jgi:hypothetical protein
VQHFIKQSNVVHQLAAHQIKIDNPITNNSSTYKSNVMDILSLPNEILLHIFTYLNNKQKCAFLCTCTLIHSMYELVISTVGYVAYHKIVNNKHFDRFRYVRFSNDTFYGFPHCMTRLNIGNCDYPITTYFPSTLTHLNFGTNYDGPIEYIPNSVTHLTLWDSLSHPILCDIPPSVNRLEFIYRFDSAKPIPNTVKHLIFGTCCGQSIYKCVPYGVTHLTLGACYNLPIYDCIPNSVTHLILGMSFNLDIANCIPNSVTHLEFGTFFDRDIKGHIPSSVRHLTFGMYFNKNLIGSIPDSVEELVIDEVYNYALPVVKKIRVLHYSEN